MEDDKRQEHSSSPFPPATGTGAPRLAFTLEALLGAAERAGLVFFRWDRTGGLLYVSESVRDVLGYTSAELVAKPHLYATLVHPDAAKELETAVRRLVSDPPERTQFLLHMRARTGRDVWLSATLLAARDEKGQVAAWDGVAIDSTELVNARRAAVEGQQVFRTLFEEAPLALLMFDPTSLVIDRANARACGLYGYPRQDLEGSFISELVSPEDWPKTLERIQRSLGEHQPSAIHHAVHRKADGTLFTAQVAGTNLVVDGKVRRFAAVFDTSGVGESTSPEAGLAQAMDVMPTPVAILDDSLGVIHVNPAFEHAVSGKKGDFVGLPLDRLLDGAGALMLRDREPELARGGRVEVRAAFARKALPPLPVFVSITPIAHSQDAPHRHLAILRVASSQGEAQATPNEDVAMFFDLLAHDVTNYLTAVRGYLEIMLASGGITGTSERMAKVAKDQSTNALDLILETRHLVDLGRTPLRAQGDLAGLLDEAVERVSPIMQARPLKVRRDYPGTKATVKAPDLLREVFVNLLHNAVKFDPHDEVILDLSIQKQTADGKAFWRVRVADRGSGIPEAQRARLFDRGFKPAQPARRAADTMAPQGSGIGLSLCRFIVERAGGTIYAESRIPGDPLQGTTFVVVLPAA